MFVAPGKIRNILDIVIRHNHPTGSVGAGEKIARRAYSLKETASTLGISESSVRRLIARGKLRPSRLLRHLMVPVEEIDRLLRDAMRTS